MYNTKLLCFHNETKLQETHLLMRELMDVEQERQKTYHDRSKYGPNYKIGKKIKKMGNKKNNYFHKGLYAMVEVIDNLISMMEDKKKKKVIKVHYDRLKNIENRIAIHSWIALKTKRNS